jgi:uncharacterized protein (TIGR02444 family)
VIRLNAEQFWEFSLAIYCKQQVAAACHSLQDRRGADVNILLFGCWLATQGCRLNDTGFKAAIAAVEDLRSHVIEPLRKVRRRLKKRFPEIAKIDKQSINHAVMSAELECERLAQGKILFAGHSHLVTKDAGSEIRSLAEQSLQAYLGLIVPEPDEQDSADMQALLANL